MILSETTLDGQAPSTDLNELLGGGPETNHQVALKLGRRGLAVFPVRDWGDDGTWKPVKDFPTKASNDPGVINHWWAKWPDARVGLLAGQRNGITVLDVDVKKGKDGLARLADLGFPNIAELTPWRVRTPSGGYHLFFRYDPDLRNSVGTKASPAVAGLDVRTNGGYVIAPLSLKDGNRYQEVAWDPDCVLPTIPEKLKGALGRPERSNTDLSDLLAPEPGPVDWDRVKAALYCIPADCERDDWRNMGMALQATGHSEAFELWAAWSQTCPDEKLRASARELRTQWQSFDREYKGRPIGIATLFKLAKAHGFDTSRPPLIVEDSEFETLPECPKSRLTFLTPADCESAPARGYVIKGLVAPGNVGCIFGAPGAGKSLIAPFLGYMVAQGQEAFQMRTKAGGVFYVAAEDPHGMSARVKALKKAHGDAPAFKLVPDVSRLLPAAGEKNAPDLQALLDAAQAQRPKLIFIDTLAIAFGSFEENNAEAMNQVVHIAQALTTWGAAVVLIHHDTKSESGTPRGHSVFNGALDVALHVKRDDENRIIRGRFTKNRNGSCEREIAFTIATEDFGFDEDGDPLTYPRCSPLLGAPTKVKRLPPSEQAALDLLEREGGSLSEADFKDALANGREVSASDSPKSRRDVAGRAIKALVQKKRITFRNGIYSTCDGFDDLAIASLPTNCNQGE